ncbi:MAG: hypothetical protein ABJG15_16900 [Hyphomonadaceae bacterium]
MPEQAETADERTHHNRNKGHNQELRCQFGADHLGPVTTAVVIVSFLFGVQYGLVGTVMNATVMGVTVFLVADFVRLEGATYFGTLLIYIPVGTVLYGTLLILFDRKAYPEPFDLGRKLIT